MLKRVESAKFGGIFTRVSQECGMNLRDIGNMVQEMDEFVLLESFFPVMYVADTGITLMGFVTQDVYCDKDLTNTEHRYGSADWIKFIASITKDDRSSYLRDGYEYIVIE